MNKKLLSGLLIAIALLTTACGGGKDAKKDAVLKVGVTAGPHAEIMEVAKKVAEKDGLKVQIVEFNDFIQPNVALNEGDLQVNSMQHKPYLENIIRDKKYDLYAIGNTIVLPMALYSDKYKNLADLPDGATVAIPNDPTNGGRALLLLQQAGVIKLKDGVGVKAASIDIVANPKNIKLKELDAAIISRSLKDVDLAAVNTNYALPAGLVPAKDAIAIEDANSPYVNVLVATGKTKDDPRVKALVKAYQSKEVKDFIDTKYQKAVIAGW